MKQTVIGHKYCKICGIVPDQKCNHTKRYYLATKVIKGVLYELQPSGYYEPMEKQ